ncbi:hypothetical protein C2845_PM11G28410 [Panicum miliaceum]|uniref:Uncharacterized protein n=1 Tax=Panicum miliaceum TaxID=4540 RepID=A0A3L6RV43_PANMI|nr:hypothetical protein C2845_PM11G28410 [Panicum miliaceum]
MRGLALCFLELEGRRRGRPYHGARRGAAAFGDMSSLFSLTHHLLARIMRRTGRSEPLGSSRTPRVSAQEIHEGKGSCPAAGGLWPSCI